jgi:hypothetical protein
LPQRVTADTEVVVVAGAEMHLAAGLERDCAIAVELQLLRPRSRIVRKRVGAEEQRRLDEARFDARGHQGSLIDGAYRVPPAVRRGSPASGSSQAMW